jgi:tetratricopeptide (TPR) repeat protein
MMLLVFGCINDKDKGQGKSENIAQASPSRVLDSLSTLLKSDSLNPELRFQRAKAALAGNNLNLAFTDVNVAASLDSNRVDIQLLKADIALMANRSRLSKQALERVVALEPGNREALMKLAELHYLVTEYKKALGYLDMLQKNNPRDAEAFFMRGMIYRDARDSSKAVAAWQSAVEIDQKHYDAYLQLGILLSAKKDPIAVQYLNNALNIKPNRTEALYAKGMFFQQIDSVRTAMKVYENILAIDSLHRSALYNSGFLNYTALKDYRTATVFFAKCIRYYPKDVDALYMRGLSFEQLGEYMKANRDYSAALEYNPAYEKAVDGIKRIANK